eukprot:3499226-Rhodomonas_salina.3
MGKPIPELMAQNKSLVSSPLRFAPSGCHEATTSNNTIPCLISVLLKPAYIWPQVDAMRAELAPVFSQSSVVGSGPYHDVSKMAPVLLPSP